MSKWPHTKTRALVGIAIALGLPIAVEASDTEAIPDIAQTYAKVKPVLDRNCSICHSQKPPLPYYAKAPAGVTFDSAQDLARFAARVLEVATRTDQMPPGNMTQMTDGERKALSSAIEAQWPTAR